MATLVKKRNKYYVRIRLPGGKEKTFPTKTGNRRAAEQFLQVFQQKEALLKARLITEAELEDLDLQDAVDRFIRECKLNGRRPTTINSYQLSLDNLVDANSPSLPVKSLTKKHFQKMVAVLHKKKIGDTNKKLKDNTINIRIRSVNTFMNWLYKEGYILDRIKVSEIKVDEPLPKFLTPQELENLYTQVHNPKMYSTLKVYEGTGIRLSELHHSHLEGNYLIIPAEYSKSRRDRMIPVDEEIKEHYRIAMTNPFQPHSVTHAFHKYAKKAKLPSDKTLHSMRHTYALRKLMETHDITVVRELLGHSDIKTTMIYTKFRPDFISELLKPETPEPTATIVGQA